MPTSQDRRFTRSKSCDGQPERGLRSAGNNSQAPHLTRRSGRSGRSPARTIKLPAPEVNNEEKADRQRDSAKVSSPPLNATTDQVSNDSSINDISISKTHLHSTRDHSVSPEDSTLPQVSDNRVSGASSHTETPLLTDNVSTYLLQAKEDPGKVLMLVLEELKEIRSQMTNLNKMENTTASLVEQLAATANRTGDLENRVNNSEDKVSKLNDNMDSLERELTAHKSKHGEMETAIQKLEGSVAPLKVKIDQHEKQVREIKVLKKEFTDISESADKSVMQMKDLIDIQREQVDSFNVGAKQIEKEWKKEVMAEIDRRFKKIEDDKYCTSLKDQAFRNRHNLVITGAKEDPDKSTFQVVKNFFNDTLKLKNLNVHSAARLGVQSGMDGTYNRPIMVKFNNLTHRNKVWRKRKAIPMEGNNAKIRIQADLPKALREGMQSLYRVVTAASKIPHFEDAKVQDYQLTVNGETYQITDLDMLPERIRLSTLSSPQSETHLVFFTRHAILSNHFPANFKVNEQHFDSMEQYLAVKRAELSEKEDFVYKAIHAKDPVQAKYVLNALHGDHQEQWEGKLDELVMTGLRAKFMQNPHLRDYLANTGNLILGEASTNARWGIGMDLNNPDVLNSTKWLESGNLLGRSLMKLREEILQGKKPPIKATTNKPPRKTKKEQTSK